MEAEFKSYCCPLTNVVVFKYIFLVPTDTYDNRPAVVANLRKARKSGR